MTQNQNQLKEPDIEKQIKDLDKKRLAKLISKKEYVIKLASISKHYDEWLKRTE